MPTALYNPRSKRRDWQLNRALEIFGQDAEVLIAKNIGRDGEELLWTKAEDLLLQEEIRDRIDMFTLLILGGKGMVRAEVSGQSMFNIVGIGPGSSHKLTFEATKLLRGSAKIFGAERYLRGIKGVSQGEQVVHQGSCTQRIALRLLEAKAASDGGQQISILAGGDPCIFSSAWRIFEAARGCHLHICSGLSAFSAVAAIAGAPLVNDHVMLSGAAEPSKISKMARAGFSIVVYNAAGQDLPSLLQEIDPSKPCAWARDVARDDEMALVMNASDLLDARPSGFRFTLIISSENSCIKDGRIINKRGYQTRYSY
jgi:precorrin-3B C17-methyltransferase